MLGSLAFALTLTVLATVAIYAKFKSYYEEKVAEKIVNAEQLINYNRVAFRELAIAGMPVRVVRTESYGVTNPGGFALVVEGADSADLRPDGDRKSGFIFFTSGRKEKQIQQIQCEVDKLEQRQPSLRAHVSAAPLSSAAR